MTDINTKHLKLAPYREADKVNFVNLLTDPFVMKFVDDGVLNRDKALTSWQKVLSNSDVRVERWCVRDRSDGSFVGHAIATPMEIDNSEVEIGYILKRSEWGKGYATEIASAVVQHCFLTRDLSRIFAGVDDDHIASINVLKKTGFEFDRYEYDDRGRYSLFVIRRRNLVAT